MASIPVSDVHLHPPGHVFSLPRTLIVGKVGWAHPSEAERKEGGGWEACAKAHSMEAMLRAGSQSLQFLCRQTRTHPFLKGSLLLWRFLSLRHILGKTSPAPPHLSGPFKSSLSYCFMRSAGAATQWLCAGRSIHPRGRRDLVFRSGLVAN